MSPRRPARRRRAGSGTNQRSKVDPKQTSEQPVLVCKQTSEHTKTRTEARRVEQEAAQELAQAEREEAPPEFSG